MLPIIRERYGPSWIGRGDGPYSTVISRGGAFPCVGLIAATGSGMPGGGRDGSLAGRPGGGLVGNLTVLTGKLNSPALLSADVVDEVDVEASTAVAVVVLQDGMAVVARC